MKPIPSFRQSAMPSRTRVTRGLGRAPPSSIALDPRGFKRRAHAVEESRLDDAPAAEMKEDLPGKARDLGAGLALGILSEYNLSWVMKRKIFHSVKAPSLFLLITYFTLFDKGN